MNKFFSILLIMLATPPLLSANINLKVADLSQDVNDISQDLGQLRLEIEDLQRQIKSLNSHFDKTEHRFKTQQQDILSNVSKQISTLSSRTQSALDNLLASIKSSTPPPSSPPPAFQFSDDYPQNGISYTVKSGDTLSVIALKHNAKTRDIQNANRIANPKSLRAGQTIFIPIN